MFDEATSGAGAVSPSGAAASADAAPAPSQSPSPSAELDRLAGLEPGPEAMAVLTGLDLGRLDAAGRVAVLLAWDRQNSWVMAQLQVATVAVAGAGPSTDHDFGADEVAVAMRLSSRGAQQRVHVARMLTQSLPGTHALLAAGQISTRHGLAMAELCAPVSEEGLHGVEARVLGRAPTQSVAEFRRSIRRAISRLFPADTDEAHEFARADRDVVLRAEPAGMASVIATLTAVEARTLFLAVDALARGRHQVEGGRKSGVGIGARRADALVALADAALAGRALPTSHGRPVELQVIIDAASLLHLANNPAELVGYGPLPAQVARDLAGDATWRRLVTDPVSGQLLDYGARAYRPPQALADYLDARDRWCRIPGCTRPAECCDHDHQVPFDKGGPTSSDNCLALCRRHHRMKTRRIWKLDPRLGGAATLTTAAGLTYQLHPPDQRDL